MNELVTDIQNALQSYFSGTLEDIDSCWEPCAWSQVYRLTLQDGTHFFLKGTPRSSHEALVTQSLSTLCSSCIPSVLLTDLLPSHAWRWFLMEDAGIADSSTLLPSVARDAVNILGTLQRYAADQYEMFSSLLIPCEGDYLQQRVMEVCQWTQQGTPAEEQIELQQISITLQGATTFFADLAAHLTDLPSTVVHGDFWSGNIALMNNHVRLLDWGDALWGVGGISVVNLLATSDAKADYIWEAYEQGWERSISLAYRQACQTASIVADLLVDQAIATTSGQGPERLRGLLPALRDLEEIISATKPRDRSLL